MKFPEEYELLGLFETEPTMLDGPEIPFFYNKSTYRYTNADNEKFTFSMSPSYKEVDLKVTKGDSEIANLRLYNIKSFDILNDSKIEKRIMLTGKNFLIKIQLKPTFSIELTEEIDN